MPLGRRPEAAGGLALSSVGVRGATGPLVGPAGPSWPGPTLGSGTDVCLAGGGDGASYFGFYLFTVLVLILMCVFGFGAAIGYVVGRRSAHVPPALPAPAAFSPAAPAGAGPASVRTVSGQAPVTHTAARGATRPRFMPLPESAAGVGL